MIENRISVSCKDANLKDYRAARRNFSWKQTDNEFSWHHTGRVNIAHEAIDRHADNPFLENRNCLVCSSLGYVQEITYSQMKLLSNCLGNGLRKIGIRKGDTVLLMLPHVPELYVSLVACAKIGAVVSLLDTDIQPDKIRHYVLDCAGKAIITTRALAPLIPDNELPDLDHIVLTDTGPVRQEKEISWEQLMKTAPDQLEPEWVSPDTPFLLVYTAVPDRADTGLRFVHGAMPGYKMTARWALDLKTDDILWTQARSSWILNTVYSAFAPWLCGITSFVSDAYDTPEDIYDQIAQNRITVLYSRPSIYQLLEKNSRLADRYNLTSLRHLASVLEPLAPKLIYAIQRTLDLTIHDTWWTAETGMITLANFRCLPLKPGAMGVPCPGLETAVLDAQGNKLAPFNMGKLAVKSDSPAMVRPQTLPASGYVKSLFANNWLLPGDTAYIDQDGFYFHQGRSDGIFVSRTGRTGTRRIEEILLQHTEIQEAGVIRYRAEDRKYRIRAFVVPADKTLSVITLEKHLVKWLEQNLPEEIRPDEIAFCSRLRRDPDNRINYRALKAIALNIPVDSLKLKKE